MCVYLLLILVLRSRRNRVFVWPQCVRKHTTNDRSDDELINKPRKISANTCHELGLLLDCYNVQSRSEKNKYLTFSDDIN